MFDPPSRKTGYVLFDFLFFNMVWNASISMFSPITFDNYAVFYVGVVFTNQYRTES